MSDDGRLFSSSQLEIWLDQQLTPEAPVYNIGGRLTIRGPLDPGMLRRAVTRVTAESDALRLRVTAKGEKLLQSADAAIDPPSIVDLTALRPAEAQAPSPRDARPRSPVSKA